MATQKITIDILAGMMNRSFMHLEKKMDDMKAELRSELVSKDEFYREVGEVKFRLDAIEGKFLNNHENRISRLEDDVRILKTQKNR